MTERNDHEPGRADLRQLAPTDAQADRVLGAVLGRIRETTPLPSDELLAFARRASRLTAIAATVLAAAAAIAVAFVERRDRSESRPEAVVAHWVETQHVPTNGELLATFQGYGGAGERR